MDAVKLTVVGNEMEAEMRCGLLRVARHRVQPSQNRLRSSNRRGERRLRNGRPNRGSCVRE
jgi:hypothetical protein